MIGKVFIDKECDSETAKGLYKIIGVDDKTGDLYLEHWFEGRKVCYLIMKPNELEEELVSVNTD